MLRGIGINRKFSFEKGSSGCLSFERRLSLLNGEQPPFAGHTLHAYAPRSTNWSPEPATRSLTVLDTIPRPVLPSPRRAPRYGPRFRRCRRQSVRTRRYEVPVRTCRPSGRIFSRMDLAQRMARAEPSKVASAAGVAAVRSAMALSSRLRSPSGIPSFSRSSSVSSVAVSKFGVRRATRQAAPSPSSDRACRSLR